MSPPARAALASLLLVLAGCTPTVHRAAPYADDASEGAAIERRAAERCCATRPDCDLPPRSFTTDACSYWPDGDWGACCIEHDIAYWCGGSDDDRRRADEAMEVCVEANSSAFMATTMYVGVRVGGVAWLPTSYRWGYGWDWLDMPP